MQLTDKTKLRAQEVLYFVAVGVGFSLAASTSFGVRQLFRSISKKYEHDELEEELYQRLYYLRRRELVRMRRVGDEVKIILTDEGKRTALQYNVTTMCIIRPDLWDKKWRLVFADIPEKNHAARDALRKKLKDLGFITLNKSVWIFPYECEREIDFVSAFFNVEQYVHYLIAEKISNDKALRKHFKLS